MSDIVERLRATAASLSSGEPGRTVEISYVDMRDAADEIEQLRAKVERLTTALTFYREGFQYHPKRSPTGIDLSTWKPKESLLDDCGEAARAALTSTENNCG